MKRKLLLGLLTVMMTASCVAALVACNDGKPDDNTEEHVHNLTYYKSVEPTCTEDGSYEYWHCSGCGKNFTDSDGSIEIDDADLVIEAIVHTWSQWYYKTDDAPTCTEGGKEYRTCEVCTFEESRDVGPRGHIGIKVEEVAAECRKDGMKAHYECERCDGLFLDEACTQPVSEESLTIEATGHTYSDEWKSDANGHWKEATCEHNVTKGPYTHDFEVFDSYEKCRDCGYIVDHKAKIVAKYIAASDLYRLSIDYSQNPEDVWVADFDTVSLPNGEQRVRIDTNLTATDTKYINLKSVDFGELNVVEIGSRAFAGCTSLTEISIPSTVETIDQSAFDGCTNLTKVTFEKGSTNSTALKTIGSQAFSYCAFASIDIPESVTAIEHGAFNFNTALTSIEIPDGVSTLESNMFNGCTALKTVTVPNDITEIGDSAFKNCKALEEFTIPETVISIDYEAFYGCSSLTSIIIPIKVTSIGSDTFRNCSALTIYCEATQKPDGWNIGFLPVVWDCNNNDIASDGSSYAIIDDVRYALKDGAATVVKQPSDVSGAVVIPETITYKNVDYRVTSIEDDAFMSCTLLEGITLPDSIEEIGYRTFYGCSSLKNVVISEGIVRIWEEAFAYCFAIEKVYIQDLAAWCNITFGSKESNPLYNGSNLYLKDMLVKDLVIPTGLTAINDYAFTGCGSIKTVTVPMSVVKIGVRAFENCGVLAKVTLSNGLESIDSMAFADCRLLAEIVIPGTVTNIEGSAFKNCETLIQTEGGVSYVGSWAVACDKAVTEVTLRTGTTGIAYGTFQECQYLKNIVIPEGLLYINNYAFSKCYMLTEVVLPNGVVSIGANAFSECEQLQSISIPDSIINIGLGVFFYCDQLIYNTYENADYLGNDENPYVVLVKYKNTAALNCTIHEDTKVIYSSAFEGCKSLMQVTIGDKVTSIGESAFEGCISLAKVTASGSVTEIGNYAFYGCTALTEVMISDSVTSIGDGAFRDCSRLTSIIYGGTIEQWNAITKGSDWDDNTDSYTIHCTDGNIAKS